MNVAWRLLSVVLLVVLVASLASCVSDRPRSAELPATPEPSVEATSSDSYLELWQEELPASRRWAEITAVTYTTETVTGRPGVEIAGQADTLPPSGRIDAYVYSSDGSCGPASDQALDGRPFRVVVELPDEQADQSVSRYEIVVIAGQYVFVDAVEWMWAQEDGGMLQSVAGAP